MTQRVSEITAVIKHSSKSIVNNVEVICKNLIELKEACKLEGISFEEHIEANKKDFKFGKSQAYKYIEVYNDKEKSLQLTGEIGIEKTHQLLHIPEAKKEELIEIAEETPTREFKKKLSGIGQDSHYAPNLEPNEQKEDIVFKLKRQLNGTLQEEFDAYLREIDKLKEQKQKVFKLHESWLDSALKHPELVDLVPTCNERLEQLQ